MTSKNKYAQAMKENQSVSRNSFLLLEFSCWAQGLVFYGFCKLVVIFDITFCTKYYYFKRSTPNINFLHFYFYPRMEIILPKAGFKTLHSIGDQFCNFILRSLFGNKKLKTDSPSKCHYYDKTRKQQDQFEYAKQLETLTQNDLIRLIIRAKEQK